MTWFSFIASIVASIAWPCVICVLLVMFKPDILRLLKLAESIKYKGIAISFTKMEEQSQILDAAQATIPSQVDSSVLLSLEDQMYDAVDRYPSAAIVLSWSALESAMADAVSNLGISPDSPSSRSPRHNLDMLASYANLSKDYLYMIQEMYSIRNKTLHQSNVKEIISREQALAYANNTMRIVRYIQSLVSPKV